MPAFAEFYNLFLVSMQSVVLYILKHKESYKVPVALKSRPSLYFAGQRPVGIIYSYLLTLLQYFVGDC